jgi:ribonuclease-3
LNKATKWLKKNLDYEFSDEDLLRQALTHRSATGYNNERLEFLGDAVLQVVISEFVFRDRNEASEGQLSRLRSSLVKDHTLSELASDLGIGEHLILGSGEKKTGGHRRASILADALEAIFGAVYLDSGFETARQFIIRTFGERITELSEDAGLRDPKSRLQEYLQGQQLSLPVYSMEQVTGKAHKQSFEVSCSVAEAELRTTGSGTTRRDAEQEAASAMLNMLETSID